jgi:hypothetical protein
MTAAGGRGETEREMRGVYSPSQLRRRRCRKVPPRRQAESSDSGTGGGVVEYVRGRELAGEVKYERGRARWSTREGGSRWVSRARHVGCRHRPRVERRGRRIRVAGGEGVAAATGSQRQRAVVVFILVIGIAELHVVEAVTP